MAAAAPEGMRSRKLWLVLLAVGLPLLGVLRRGIDATWDLRNYHLYNAHAWLTGRDAIDIAPAQLQSWHNPLLDVPFYLLATSGLSLHWASLWLAAPAMASLFFVLALHGSLSDRPPSRFSQAILALLCISGAAAFSTLGLSTNDGFVGAAMLGALAVLLAHPGEQIVAKRWLLAGFIAGAMAGLKLSAAFYCIGLGCAALVASGWSERVRQLAALGLGGVTGFVLSFGAWGWHLYRQFGNPFFPYWNNYFQSPLVAPQSWTDQRFQPASFADALLAPLHLLQRNSRFSEIDIRDPRLLIALVGLVALTIAWRRAPWPRRQRVGILLVFVLVSFALWIGLHGIYRYVIALEMLGALALVLLLDRLPRWRRSALLLALVLVSADTRRPDWGHTRDAAPKYGMTAASLPADSLVVMATQEPLGYLVLAIPPEVPVVSVFNNFMSPQNCSGLQLRAQQAIAKHEGPVFLLRDLRENPAQSLVERYYGLQSAGRCQVLASSLGEGMLCPQRRGAPAGTPNRLACPTPGQ